MYIYVYIFKTFCHVYFIIQIVLCLLYMYIYVGIDKCFVLHSLVYVYSLYVD